MKIENQVCTIDQAKKIKALGVDLKTYFSWVNNGDDNPSYEVLPTLQITDPSKTIYPAPTVAELGDLLPSSVSLEDEDLFIQGSLGNRKGEFHYIWFQSSLDNVEWELFPAVERDTEAEARCEALIWLLENDFVTKEDLV